MKSHLNLVGLFGLTLALACGSGDSEVNGAADGSDRLASGTDTDVRAAGAAEGSAETLNEFDVQGTHVTFLGADGGVWMMFQSSVFAPMLQVEAVDGGGNLTPLELFTAYQPEGIPNDKLVEHHVLATQLQGRADASIREAVLVPVVRDKTLLDDCFFAFAPIVGSQIGVDPFSKKKSIRLLNEFILANETLAGEKGNMAAGVCNFSPGAANGEKITFAKKVAPATTFTTLSSPTLAANDLVFAFFDGNDVTLAQLRAIVTKTALKTMQAVSLAQRHPL